MARRGVQRLEELILHRQTDRRCINKRKKK